MSKVLTFNTLEWDPYLRAKTKNVILTCARRGFPTDGPRPALAP